MVNDVMFFICAVMVNDKSCIFLVHEPHHQKVYLHIFAISKDSNQPTKNVKFLHADNED